MTTHRQQALSLLRLHQGACSVPKGGTWEAMFTILRMEEAVKITPSGTPGFINVYDKNFKPRFAAKTDL